MTGLIDPTRYGVGWYVAIAALVVLFVVWLLVIPKLTASRVRVSDQAATEVPPPPKTVRDQYRERIEDLAAALRADTLSERAAHRELSAIVREFVSLVTGVPTRTMTYSDLADNDRTAAMAEVIAQCYQPEFSSEGTLGDWDRDVSQRPITFDNALKVVETL